jgi:hypothetical protein
MAEQAAEKVIWYVIAREARNSHLRKPRKERFLTPQTPFGMTKGEFFRKL